MAKKSKLDKKKKEDVVKPPFVMADPNDDAAAYGWTLGKLRYPGEKVGGEQWPGAYVFDFPVEFAVRQMYGHSIEFASPSFLQLILDSEPAIRAGAEKVRAAGYTPEAIKKYRKTVIAVFQEKILPVIAERFEDVAGMVAEFYAARLAHIDTFGAD